MNQFTSGLRHEIAKADTVSRVALLIGVWVVFTMLDPGFLSTDSVYSVLQGFAFLGLVAVGVGVAMVAGELDLSVASVAAVAGIVAVELIDIGLVPAVVLAGLLMASVGAAQGFLIARLGINSLVFTIGTLFALRGVAHLLTDSQAVLLPLESLDATDTLIERLGIFSPYSIATLAIMLVVGMGLAFSRWGRELYAVGGARHESAAAGVPQIRPIVVAFTVSGFTAGLAGGLSAMVAGSGSSQAYANVLLLAVTAALIGGIGLYGGRGSMINIVLGALILQSFVAGLVNQSATQDVQQLATGGLLLLVIVVEFVTSDDDNGRAAGLRRRLGRRRSEVPQRALT